jgi:hypothetical protein
MPEMAVLPEKIAAHLNNGYTIAAEVTVPISEIRRFVRIRPFAKPDVPREERRFLNSRYYMWQYWDYAFRRMTLRAGWETDEWNYDRYLVKDEIEIATSEPEFEALLGKWVPDVTLLRHIQDSERPE